VAPANSKSTAPTTGGIYADCRTLSSDYSAQYISHWGATELVRPYVDQYRSAILEGREGQLEEYLVFSANSSNLSVVEDPTYPINDATVAIPSGTQQVSTDDAEGYTFPLVGAVQLTAGSDQLVGTGTSFLSQLIEGASVVTGFYVVRVASVESDTEATLETAPTGTFYGAAAVINPISDGTTRLVVTDDGGRTIAGVLAVIINLGDDDLKIDRTLTTSSGDISCDDPEAGLITINDTSNTRGLLRPMDGSSPAMSRQRGDRVVEVVYYLASPRFWWTRNDPEMERFHWQGKDQRWEPIKGGAPINMGRLLPDESYELTPKPQNLTIGEYLPGAVGPHSLDKDQYAMLRLGAMPSANSIPLGDDETGADFRGIEVVPDDIAASGEYDFGSRDPAPAGIVGETNGIIVWNPALFMEYAGQVVWYIPRTLNKDSKGVVGKLSDADQSPLFIAPIPGVTDHALLRIGSRRWLKVSYFENDNELPDEVTIETGNVAVSLSTGMVLFSPADVTKTIMGDVDSPNPDFNKLFVGDKVFYDGIVLNRMSQPARAAASLGVISGDFTFSVPDAKPEGLGTSGILHVEDKVGAVPAHTVVNTRPGDSGLMRQVKGIGDTFFFVPGHPFEKLSIRDTADDLPDFPFMIRRGKVYVTEGSTNNSHAMIGFKDLMKYNDKPLYFLQADFTPATYAEDARMVSRKEGPFTLRGDEKLSFIIDNDPVFEWDAIQLTGSVTEEGGLYSATEVALSIDTLIANTAGTCYEFNGRLVIAPNNITNGTVEILYGQDGVKDFSGTAALGFGPGWKTTAPIDPSIKGTALDPNWLVDSGQSIGLWRSPFNEDGSGVEPDFKSTSRIEGEMLTTVQPVPFTFIQQIPLVDIAGVDDGVFFEIQAGPYRKRLEAMEDIHYRFEDRQFAWLDNKRSSWAAEAPVSYLNLGGQGIVEETLHPALNGYLRASFGGDPFALLQPGEDFLLPQEGLTGMAVLVEEIGGLAHYGSKGFFDLDGTTLTDTDAGFVAAGIEVGDRLKLNTGDAAGSYRIVDVTAEVITVEPAFPADSGSAPMSWEIYDQKTKDVIDPQVVADQVYQQFNHLPEEPFYIRKVSYVGDCPSQQDPANPLQAIVGKDLQSGRRVVVRAGLDFGSPELEVLWLDMDSLGTISNAGIYIPDPTSQRVLDGDFELHVGVEVLRPGVELLSVSEFSEDPDFAEYLDDGTGEVRFSGALLDSQDQAQVVYVETPSSSLEPGFVEVNQGTGDLNLSSADLSQYTGASLYWAAQMITEQQKDVYLNPLAGAFMFREPLGPGQIVEVEYRVSDKAGQLATGDEGEVLPVINENLPLYVRRESCVRINAQQYSFNPEGKTVFDTVTPLAYFGAEQANYDYDNASIDIENGLINFFFEVEESTNVSISYAVLEAFGGELSYTVSKPPVYRPPFRLEGGLEEFQLESDRTGDLVEGALLRIGGASFYLKSVEYDAGTGLTTVGIFPPVPGLGVGSSAPGNDTLTLYTAEPIAHVVDPDGDAIATDGPGGFLVPIQDLLELAEEPVYEPVSKGRTELVVVANCMGKFVAGHILEIGGCPHSIVGLKLSDDGRRTTIAVTPDFPKGFTYGTDSVSVTTRPVYPPAPIDYIGAGAYLPDLPYEVVLWGERNIDGTEKPGRTLAEGIHYAVDPMTGNITLQQPLQAPLQATQQLYFARTRITTARPELHRGQVVFPRFATKFRHTVAPSQDNGLQGAALLGTYTFRSPDSFYCRTVPLLDHMGEVALDMVKEANSKNPSFGPSTGGWGGSKNWEQGRVGLTVEREHLLDTDRAGRKFLAFYNATIVAFEQITENISGRMVGDRDGKFRFWVGEGLEFTPPGWENPVTGRIVPRNIWTEVFVARRGASSVYIQDDDWVVVPNSSSFDTDGQVEGDWIEGDDFDFMLQQQRRLIRNDLDDLIIVGRKRPRIILRFLPLPHFIIKAKGRFERMADPNEFSRIFPERASGFTTLFPGVGANPEAGDYGEHLFLGIRGGKLRSSFFRTSGNISNPVLGEINDLTDIDTYPRTSRARIYKYSSVGFPEWDALLGSDFTNNPQPAIVATPNLLVDFPLDEQGKPDVGKLATMMDGGAPDLTTGDWEISTPGFRTGMKIKFGRPTGEFFDGGHTDVSLDIFGMTKVKPVFVGAIYKGCVMTFTDGDDPITNGNAFVEMTSDDGGPPIELLRGYTITQALGGGVEVELNDPPTAEDMAMIASAMPNFRKGFDYSVRMRRGEYRDISFPSFSDPTFFGLKDLLGQKTPSPQMEVESIVEFRNFELEPLEIPALLGENRDDDGDWTIPYMGVNNTELQRLQEAARAVTGIALSDCTTLPVPQPHVHKAVYPDEVLSLDGSVAPDGPYPAAMATEADLSPTNGTYEAHTGVGDVRSYDLLLIEPDDDNAALPPGSQGILEIGAVVPSDGPETYIEPPRFVSPTTEGAEISYTIANATAWSDHSTGYLAGLRVDEWVIGHDTDPPNYPDRYTETHISTASIGAGFLVLDDGDGGGSFDPSVGDWPEGGLNSVLSNCAEDTKIQFDILARPLDLADPQPGDGMARATIQLRVGTAGTSGHIVDIDGAHSEPVFFLSVYDHVAGGQRAFATDTSNNPVTEVRIIRPDNDGGIYFDGSKLIIRTVHPSDEHTDPVDALGNMPGDGGYGFPADPDYDEFTTAQWFPFDLFESEEEDTDGDEEFFPPGHPNAGDPNPDYDADHFWTYGLDDVGNELFLDFTMQFEVVKGKTAYIDTDRLSFIENFDFRLAWPRGTKHPLWDTHGPGAGDTDFEIRLEVSQVEGTLFKEDMNPVSKQEVHLTINNPDSVNAGDPFTFKSRDGTTPDTVNGVGFVTDTHAGVTALKVMPWEGHGNVEIDFTGATFSAMPSSEVAQDDSVFLCKGSGVMDRLWEDATPVWARDSRWANKIRVYTKEDGSSSFNPSKVMAGDTLAVNFAPEDELDLLTDGAATVKEGTYLVRHAVSSNAITDTYDANPGSPAEDAKPAEARVRAMTLVAPAPGPTAWAQSYFPTITEVEDDSGTHAIIHFDELVTWEGHELHGAWDDVGTTGVGNGNPLYIYRSTPQTDDTVETFCTRVFKADYTHTSGETSFKIDLSTVADACGQLLSVAPYAYSNEQILAQLVGDEEEEIEGVVGKRLFGIQRMPLNITGAGLPNKGVTGHTEHTDYGSANDVSLLGFSAISIKVPSLYDLDSVLAGAPVDYIGYSEWSVPSGNLVTTTSSTYAVDVGMVLEEAAVPNHQGEFREEEPEFVHEGGALLLDLSDVTDDMWKTLTQTAELVADALDTAIFALMPTSQVATSFFDHTGGTETDLPGYYAEAGIFLEPSFPRSVGDLNDDGTEDSAFPGEGLVFSPRVSCDQADGPPVIPGVDLTDSAVGSRGSLDFVTDTATWGDPLYNRVAFSVRRVRRWHDVLDDFSTNLQALRFCYEIRYGTIDSYTGTGNFATFVAEGEGTQLGGFDNDDVNINPGDQVRVLHPITGEVIATAEIGTITDAKTLSLRPPGLVGTAPDSHPDWSGLAFQVFMRIAPVPHEQSNEELLELTTDVMVYRRTMEWTPANPDSPDYPDNGGFILWDTADVGTWAEYVATLPDPHTPADFDEWKALVYEASINRFTDTNAGLDPGQINFQQEGVKEGDILIIDPAGALEPPGFDPEDQEYGTRPYGDIGTPNRGESEADVGRPAELDDNRGYYVVQEVKPTELLVLPYEESPFSGPDANTNVLVEEGTDSEFSWYPTISASDVGREGKEGQTDLRPTHWSGTNPVDPDGLGVDPGKFAGCPLSIAPVSWMVIRPSGFFSEESTELALFHRERILSLMENFEAAMRGDKTGSYRVFRENRHVFDLGHPNIAEEGLGVPFNRFLFDVAGMTTVSPYLNDADCLSILDRRVHGQDLTLDELKPPYSDYSDPSIAYYTDLGEGVGRPLLVDRIDEVLNNSDRFRALRFAWLNFRAHRINGTLAKVDRWDRELPKRIREMERLRRMTEGAGGR
jgi:hypothetical protein